MTEQKKNGKTIICNSLRIKDHSSWKKGTHRDKEVTPRNKKSEKEIGKVIKEIKKKVSHSNL